MNIDTGILFNGLNDEPGRKNSDLNDKSQEKYEEAIKGLKTQNKAVKSENSIIALQEEQKLKEDVYIVYQYRIKQSEQLQAEILNAVNPGISLERTKELLIKACDTIGNLTSNKLFSETVRKKLGTD